MTTTARTRYRLFALETNRRTLSEVTGHRFSRVTQSYTLIYTDAEQPEASVEVAGNDLQRLSADDVAWLTDCNIVLLMDATKEREGEISERMEEMIQRFSDELEKEADSNGIE